MIPGPPFSLQGLTFSVLGSTGTHLWDHPGAPERPFETTLAHLRNQTPKKHKKTTFGGPVLEPKLDDISCFFWPLVLHAFRAKEMKSKCRKICRKRMQKLHFLTIILKLRNSVSTAPARADRGSRLPETVNKLTKKTCERKLPTHMMFYEIRPENWSNKH